MKMRADPLLVAVALGLLNPMVFQIADDAPGEATPPPMLQPVAVDAPSAGLSLSPAATSTETLTRSVAVVAQTEPATAGSDWTVG
jgi:hypothetical protein